MLLENGLQLSPFNDLEALRIIHQIYGKLLSKESAKLRHVSLKVGEVNHRDRFPS